MTKKFDVDFNKFDLESYVSEFAERDSNKSVNGDAWFNCCFHDGDDNASLHVTDKQKYYCHGCGNGGGVLDFVKNANNVDNKKAFEIIKQYSGQEDVSTTFEKRKPKLFYEPKNYESVYSYNHGYVLKYRLPNKEFMWANFSDNQWWYGTGEYNVELYKPNGLAELIVFAEGEKDVDLLCQMGFHAVSIPNGSNSWKESYVDELDIVKKVVILNDNDKTGIENAMKINATLITKGFECKRILPIQLNESDKKGYDIFDVAQDIGFDKTKELLNYHINDSARWDARVYWDHEILSGVADEEPKHIEKEVVEAEVVVDSGMGEEFDALVEKAIQEHRSSGMISPKTTIEIKEYGSKSGLGVRYMNNYINTRIQEEKASYVSNIESKVVSIPDIDRDLDISGSGYYVTEETGAIFNDFGNEVIGHFLSFVGIVEDAEKEQDSDVKVMLAYNTPQNLSKINRLVTSKKNLSTTQDIVKLLSGHNINVTSVNASDVVKYLQDQQNFFNENTIKLKSLSRFGWFNNQLMPFEQDSSELVFDTTVAQPIANKLLDTKGEREVSLELLKEMAQYSENIATIIGAAVGSLVLSYMNDGGNQSFALNVWGGTSTGKSVACQGVASMFGYPFKDNGWWGDGNATMLKDIYHNSLLGNLPNFIDDPALNRGYDSVAKRDYVYAATSGQSRGRMHRSGETAQNTKEWCNVMIMTNETRFIDDSVADGGAKARCIEVKFDKPLDQKTASRWVETMGKNYGHFAIDIAETIRSCSKHSLESFLKKYIKWFNYRGVDGKRAVNAAVIMLGLKVADDALDLKPLNPDNWLVKQILGSGVLNDGQRGFTKLISIIETSAQVYRNIYDIKGVFVGSYGLSSSGDRVVNLPYRTIERYGKDNGFNVDTVISWGMANGRMVPNYTEYDTPKGIEISNGVDTLKVIQVYYDWSDYEYSQDRINNKFTVEEV